ncbi:hypothetical protein EGO51_15510 [Haloarcula hispanica]|uniref:Uncharacterized protein n=1 Tax=Haloarcula hispanica TaxID=51589 RepID=A0A5J5LD49_HALHI|nr:hypothetical protein EGO51_15510 [Haloarcula hispanica]MUV49334.1 hypothetical protein [Haloarcula sp. CBA1122]
MARWIPLREQFTTGGSVRSRTDSLRVDINLDPTIAIVAIENQCTPDRTIVVRSVCNSFQLLL